MPVNSQASKKLAKQLYDYKAINELDMHLYLGLINLSACMAERCNDYEELLGRMEGKKDAAAKIYGLNDELYLQSEGILYAIKENEEFREKLFDTYKSFMEWKLEKEDKTDETIKFFWD